MTNPNDENPYKPTGNEAPSSDEEPEIEYKPSAIEKFALLLLGIVVAIPVFLTTCIGGGLGLIALNVGSLHRGFPDVVMAILWLGSFGVACWAGLVVARFVKRKRGRKALSKDTP